MAEPTVEANQVILEENIGEEKTQEIMENSNQESPAVDAEENTMRSTTIITTTTTSSDETDATLNQGIKNMTQQIAEDVTEGAQQNVVNTSEAQQQISTTIEESTTTVSTVVEQSASNRVKQSEAQANELAENIQKQSEDTISKVEDKGKEVQDSATKMVAEASTIKQNLSKNTVSENSKFLEKNNLDTFVNRISLSLPNCPKFNHCI